MVLNFSWGDCNSQNKLKTIIMQNFGGETKSYGTFEKGLLLIHFVNSVSKKSKDKLTK